MTTHWIISIGRPKLRVMSGKAMLTALSSGTTEVPSPISASRSPCRAVIPGRAAAAVSAGASAGMRGAVLMTAIVAEERCSICSFSGKNFCPNPSRVKISLFSGAYYKVGAVLGPVIRGTLTRFDAKNPANDALGSGNLAGLEIWHFQGRTEPGIPTSATEYTP